MKNQETPANIILPAAVFEEILNKLDQILERLNDLKVLETQSEYLTAKEFMKKTKMCRTSFDEKRARNEFKVIKKGRKVYIPASEVNRFFEP